MPASHHLPGAQWVTDAVAKMLQSFNIIPVTFGIPSLPVTSGQEEFWCQEPPAKWWMRPLVGSCAVGGISADEQSQFLVEIC